MARVNSPTRAATAITWRRVVRGSQRGAVAITRTSTQTAAVIESPNALPCRPCHKPICHLRHHLCMRDIAVEQVMAATHIAIAQAEQRAAMQ